MQWSGKDVKCGDLTLWKKPYDYQEEIGGSSRLAICGQLKQVKRFINRRS
jgi:hypothetical protein